MPPERHSATGRVVAYLNQPMIEGPVIRFDADPTYPYSDCDMFLSRFNEMGHVPVEVGDRVLVAYISTEGEGWFGGRWEVVEVFKPVGTG